MLRFGRVQTALLLAVALSFSACSSGSKLYGPGEWQSRGAAKTNEAAVVYVNAVDFACRIVTVSTDKIMVVHDGAQKELPSEIVSRIVFESSSRRTRTWWGAGIGTVLGGVAGFFAGSEAGSGGKSLSNLGHPIALAIMLGGGVAGALIGGSGSNPEEYILNQRVEPFVLNETLGKEITPAELKLYDLFGDLRSEDDQLLQVQVFRLKDKRYLLLFDLRRFGEYTLDWRIVDAAYIESQMKKVTQ